MTDDTLVRIPGQAEPVKYGELYKRLQADHTKKTQEVAKTRAEIAREQADWKTRREAEELSLRNTAAALLQRGQTGPAQGGNEFLAQLEARPYVDGKTMAAVVKAIQTDGFGSIVKAIEDRDTVIKGLYGRLNALDATVKQLSGVHQETGFNARISQTLKELDMPEEAAELAKEIYLAYEGNDLDNEFPNILQTRWNQMQAMFQKRQQATLDANRRQVFPLPGKGGTGTPGKGIPLFRGDENAREMADKLWPQMSTATDT